MKLFYTSVIILFCGIVLMSFWNYNDFSRSQARHITSFDEKGNTVLTALRAATNSTCKAQRVNIEDLSELMNRMVELECVAYVALHGKDSIINASAKVPSQSSVMESLVLGRSGQDVTNFVPFTVSFTPTRGRNNGRGHGSQYRLQEEGYTRLKDEDLSVTVVMDKTQILNQISTDKMRLVFFLLIALLATILLSVFTLFTKKRILSEMELAEQRRKSERMGELAMLGAGLAHETKNPLGVIRGRAQRMGKEGALIVDEVDRVVNRVNSFLQFAKPKDPVLENVELLREISSLTELLDCDFSDRNISVSIEGPEITVIVDREMLRQAIMNLMLNAKDAIDGAGTISILMAVSSGSVSVSILDSGSGISKEEMVRIHEPYFTTKQAGTGLGLSIVHSICDAHGWKLEIESTVGKGTRASIKGIERTRNV